MRERCWHHKHPVSWIIGLNSMSCFRALFKSGQASPVPDREEMLVALSRRCVSGRACHGGGTGRDGHHHRWVGLVLGDGAINGFTVIRAVGDNRGDDAGNLLEQWANLRGVALLAWITAVCTSVGKVFAVPEPALGVVRGDGAER